MDPTMEKLDQIENQLIRMDEQVKDHFQKDDSRSIKEKIFTLGVQCFSALIVLAGTLLTFVIQQNSIEVQKNAIEEQKKMNQYAVTFNAKQKGYADLMKAIQTSFMSSANGERDEMIANTEDISTTFYVIEPFISKPGLRDHLWDEMQTIILSINKVCDSKTAVKDSDKFDDFMKEYKKKRDDFSNELRKELFSTMTP